MSLHDPLREEIRRLRKDEETGPLADALISLLSLADDAETRGSRTVPAASIKNIIVRNVLRG